MKLENLTLNEFDNINKYFTLKNHNEILLHTHSLGWLKQKKIDNQFGEDVEELGLLNMLVKL